MHTRTYAYTQQTRHECLFKRFKVKEMLSYPVVKSRVFEKPEVDENKVLGL